MTLFIFLDEKTERREKVMRKIIFAIIMLLGICFGISFEASAASVVATKNGIEIRVVKGDTIWDIAWRYNVPFSVVMEMNKGRFANLNRIYEGDIVLIPHAKNLVKKEKSKVNALEQNVKSNVTVFLDKNTGYKQPDFLSLGQISQNSFLAKIFLLHSNVGVVVAAVFFATFFLVIAISMCFRPSLKEGDELDCENEKNAQKNQDGFIGFKDGTFFYIKEGGGLNSQSSTDIKELMDIIFEVCGRNVVLGFEIPEKFKMDYVPLGKTDQRAALKYLSHLRSDKAIRGPCENHA